MCFCHLYTFLMKHPLISYSIKKKPELSYYWVVKFSLYSGYNLSAIHFKNIFSQPMGFFFLYLTVSFQSKFGDIKIVLSIDPDSCSSCKN